MSKTKPAFRSKQIWGTLVTVVSAVFLSYGIAADIDFLADGFQLAEDFEQLFGMIGVVGGALFRDYGQRNAEERIEGVVNDKN